MDIELDRDDLDKSIEVLSSAARTLRLTRFESLSYRALMLSVDVATVTLLLVTIFSIFGLLGIALVTRHGHRAAGHRRFI